MYIVILKHGTTYFAECMGEPSSCHSFGIPASCQDLDCLDAFSGKAEITAAFRLDPRALESREKVCIISIDLPIYLYRSTYLSVYLSIYISTYYIYNNIYIYILYISIYLSIESIYGCIYIYIVYYPLNNISTFFFIHHMNIIILYMLYYIYVHT